MTLKLTLYKLYKEGGFGYDLNISKLIKIGP